MRQILATTSTFAALLIASPLQQTHLARMRPFQSSQRQRRKFLRKELKQPHHIQDCNTRRREAVCRPILPRFPEGPILVFTVFPSPTLVRAEHTKQTRWACSAMLTFLTSEPTRTQTILLARELPWMQWSPKSIANWTGSWQAPPPLRRQKERTLPQGTASRHQSIRLSNRVETRILRRLMPASKWLILVNSAQPMLQSYSASHWVWILNFYRDSSKLLRAHIESIRHTPLASRAKWMG